MKKVLITTHLLPEGLQELQQQFEVCQPEKELFTEDELIRLIPEYDALISTFVFQINAKVMDAAARLKIIANYGVGYNNIDVDYATRKGIVVTNTPQPVTEPTAEMAMALLYAVARRVAECDRKLRTPNAIEWGVLKNLGMGLYGKTLGIIGLGRIGKAIARRAIASGMNIVYYNRHQLSLNKETEYQAQYLPLEELLKTSDVISISTPLTDETHHLIDAPQFELMKPTAIVINTARGAVINEAALVKALQRKQIWGAGLDVYEFEPNVNSELLQLDNVVLAPHNGTATVDARNAIARDACRNIINFFNGNKDISIVNQTLKN
jgi:D-3-phosphoglycerate dehydrogenase